MTPVALAADQLRALHTAALAAAPDAAGRTAAHHSALAAGLALMASILAADEQQLETVRRLMAEYSAGEQEADPPRTVLTVCVVLARHILIGQDEGRTVAAAYQAAEQAARDEPERRTDCLLAGAAQVLLLTAAWLDDDRRYAAELRHTEGALRSLTGAAALVAVLDLLGLMVVPEWQAPADPEPAAAAFAASLAVAEGLAQRLL